VCDGSYSCYKFDTYSVLHGLTSHEGLFFVSLNLSHLRVLGCLCYIHYRDKSKDKFAPRSRRCVFSGYPFGKKGWKVMDLASRDVFVSQNVLFEEHIFPFKTTREETSASPPPPLFQPDEFYDELPASSSSSPTPVPGGAPTTDPPVSKVLPDPAFELVPNPTPSNHS